MLTNMKMEFLDGGGYKRACVRTDKAEWSLCWIPENWRRLGSFSVEWFDGSGKHYTESVSAKTLAHVQVYN